MSEECWIRSPVQIDRLFLDITVCICGKRWRRALDPMDCIHIFSILLVSLEGEEVPAPPSSATGANSASYQGSV